MDKRKRKENITLASFRHSLAHKLKKEFTVFQGAQIRPRKSNEGLLKKHILSYQYSTGDGLNPFLRTDLKSELTPKAIMTIMNHCINEYQYVFPKNARGVLVDKEEYIKIYLGLQIYRTFRNTKTQDELEDLIKSFTTKKQFNIIIHKAKTRFPQLGKVTDERKIEQLILIPTIEKEKTYELNDDEDEEDEDSCIVSSSTSSFSFEMQQKIRIQYFTTPVYLSNGQFCEGVFI
jgi:hypothetical protein